MEKSKGGKTLLVILILCILIMGIAIMGKEVSTIYNRHVENIITPDEFAALSAHAFGVTDMSDTDIHNSCTTRTVSPTSDDPTTKEVTNCAFPPVSSGSQLSTGDRVTGMIRITDGDPEAIQKVNLRRISVLYRILETSFAEQQSRGIFNAHCAPNLPTINITGENEYGGREGYGHNHIDVTVPLPAIITVGYNTEQGYASNSKEELQQYCDIITAGNAHTNMYNQLKEKFATNDHVFINEDAYNLYL